MTIRIIDNTPPLTNLAFFGAGACTDDELVEMLAAEDLFIAAREDVPVPNAVVRKAARTVVCADRDGVVHSPNKKRKAARAFIAAMQAYYEQPVGIALLKLPFDWNDYATCIVTSAEEVWKAQGRRI